MRSTLTFTVGGIAIVAWTAIASWSAPSPGGLSSPHQRLGGDGGRCTDCHGPDGITPSCLACHEEIQRQLQSGEGYHASIRSQGQERCETCHGEHYGEAYPLVGDFAFDRASPDGFQHEFTRFDLHQAHDDLDCEACHRSEWTAIDAAPAERVRSFLGLRQECSSCHVNVHGQGVEDDCSTCHFQDSFRPASKFDHSKVYALEGKHQDAACEGCHKGFGGRETGAEPISALRLPDAPALSSPLLLDVVAGQTCKDCHENPHQGRNESMYGEDCARCHDPATFEVPHYTVADHAPHFRLDGAHAEMRCVECHQKEDCPLPGAKPETCETCHTNPHEPTLAATTDALALFRSETCSRCHQGGRWETGDLAEERHEALAFPLREGHAGIDCQKCHERPTVQPSTRAESCADCHADPHRGVFSQTCSECHLTDEHTVRRGFGRMSDAAHHRTGFDLTAPHAALACETCHPAGQVFAERFPGRTPEQCTACHGDPHAGQFGARAGDCLSCHDPLRFLPSHYGVAEHTTFPLEGNHLAVACQLCHLEDARLQGARRFAGTSAKCTSCHQDPHGGQFAAELRSGKSCQACHAGFDGWEVPPIDHDRTAFPLKGAHAKAACNDCHRDDTPKLQGVRQFRGVGTRCLDCHEDVHRGQLLGPKTPDCNSCHTSLENWDTVNFDHDRQSRYRLEGVHRDLACAKCHLREVEDGVSFVRYKPLGTECRDCHDVE